MRLGIGVAAGPDPAKAAREAARQALRGAPRPTLALAFAGVKLDARAVHASLARELPAAALLGGSSYAEITPAGVSRDSVAVLLAEWPSARLRLAFSPFAGGPAREAERLAGGAAPLLAGRTVGLLLTPSHRGRDDELLAGLHERLPGVPFFGGLLSGDYDAGMGRPEFWRSRLFAGPRLRPDFSALALLGLPRGAAAGFGFEHGWTPVGPLSRVTRARGGRVLEIDGMSAVSYYRQFFGRAASREVLRRSIQRHGLALHLEGEFRGKTLIKLPVGVDFARGSVDFYPPERLEDRTVQLIAATRAGAVEGAREAARRARAALGPRRPSLVLAVSCCTRGRFLNSRLDDEMSAAREVFGPEVPLFGFYSGGELLPFLSGFREASDRTRAFGGSHYHTTTVGFLALALPGLRRPPVPPRPPEALGEGLLLGRSEAALNDAEAFLANLSRKSAEDAQALRRQSEVIRRYTPHGVWGAAGESAFRGVYELPDSSFHGAFLFMDVKGFTAFAEARPPREVVAALNAILGPAADAVHACGGDVDKFVGDCVFAVFPGPAEAVKAGLRILETVARQAAAGGPFSVRVGVHAGRAVRANVGSRDRREYTFIGDAVNLAQRLESQAPAGAMLVSSPVYAAVRRAWPRAPRRRLRVKGRSRGVLAYELRPGAP